MSQEYIDRHRKLIGAFTLFYRIGVTGIAVVLAFFGVQGVIFSWQYNLGVDWVTVLPLFFAVVFPVAIFVLTHKLNKAIVDKLGAQRIRLTEGTVERENGKWNETIPYTAIKEVRIQRNREGNPIRISLKTDEQDYIFEHLEDSKEFFQILQSRLFKVSISEERAWWLDFGKPSLCLAFWTIAGLVTSLSLYAAVGPVTTDLLQICVTAAIGIFILVKRPATNGIASVETQRKYGLISLLCGVAMLILLLF